MIVGEQAFVRSDSNEDSLVDLTDPIFTIRSLFTGASPAPGCFDSADANDNGFFDLSDAIYALNYLFLDGGLPADPFLPYCGLDLPPDSLDCACFNP